MSRHCSDAKQRASKRYREKHAKLARELAADERRREKRNRSGKQIRGHLQSEFWRAFAETMTA